MRRREIMNLQSQRPRAALSQTQSDFMSNANGKRSFQRATDRRYRQAKRENRIDRSQQPGERGGSDPDRGSDVDHGVDLC